MSGQRYTREDLLHIRASPLVQRPEHLPSIEQWIDQTQDQNRNKVRTQNGRENEPTSMGNFGSQQRPSLLQTRQSSRAVGDDVVLGPPKTSFASSRSINRLADAGDGASSQGITDEDRDLESLSARTKYFRERDEQNGKGVFNKERESWTAGRGNKSYEGRNEGRNDGRNEGRTGFGDKDRTFGGRNQRDRGNDVEEEGNRRSGYGYKNDQRWSRDGDKMSGRPPVQERGWRDNREKRSDRDYDRSGPQEREPEWLDEPLEQDEPEAHTVAEFEKWKQKMKAGKNPIQEKENRETEQDLPLPTPKASAPLLQDAGFGGGMFSSWGEKRPETVVTPDLVIQQEPTPAKSSGAKKSSRFASMFAPKEEPRQMEMPASPASFMAAANGSSEDQEGFNRMLQMLRGTTVAPTGRPGQTVASPGGQPPNMLNLFGSGGPEARQIQQTQSPHPPGLQALFGKPGGAQSGRPETPALNKDSEFLLNLIQTKNASRPQSQAARPPEQDNFQLFLDQPAKQQSHAPQHRGPPPGFPSEQMYPPRDPNPGQEQRQPMPRPPPGFFEDPAVMLGAQKQPIFSPHAEHQSPQRMRTAPSGPPTGLPSGFPPHLANEPHFFPPPPGGPSTGNNERMPLPPPGFNPNMRLPQGFPNMPIFQDPSIRGPMPPNLSQLPPPSSMRVPPGIASPNDGPNPFGNMPPGFFGGPPPGMGGGPPPGFGGLPPPGLQMGMRREDERYGPMAPMQQPQGQAQGMQQGQQRREDVGYGQVRR